MVLNADFQRVRVSTSISVSASVSSLIFFIFNITVIVTGLYSSWNVRMSFVKLFNSVALKVNSNCLGLPEERVPAVGRVAVVHMAMNVMNIMKKKFLRRMADLNKS